MLKITVTNIDKDTQDIIAYIAEKAGGKVLSSKEKKQNNDVSSEQFAVDFLSRMDKNWKENIEHSYKKVNAKSK